jgi:hypothetical protein
MRRLHDASAIIMVQRVVAISVVLAPLRLIDIMLHVMLHWLMNMDVDKWVVFASGWHDCRL